MVFMKQADSSVELASLLDPDASVDKSHDGALDTKLVYRAVGELHNLVENYVSAVLFRAVAASLFAALLAGVAFGFNALKPILLDADVLHTMCPVDVASKVPCDAQVVALNSLLDLAALTANFTLLPVSLLVQRLGLRWSIFASGLITAGSVTLFGWAADGVHGLTGVSHESRLTIMRFAYLLIALGGSTVFTTVNSYPMLLKRAEPHPRAKLQAIFSTIISACWVCWMFRAFGHFE